MIRTGKALRTPVLFIEHKAVSRRTWSGEAAQARARRWTQILECRSALSSHLGAARWRVLDRGGATSALKTLASMCMTRFFMRRNLAPVNIGHDCPPKRRHALHDTSHALDIEFIQKITTMLQ